MQNFHPTSPSGVPPLPSWLGGSEKSSYPRWLAATGRGICGELHAPHAPCTRASRSMSDHDLSMNKRCVTRIWSSTNFELIAIVGWYSSDMCWLTLVKLTKYIRKNSGCFEFKLIHVDSCYGHNCVQFFWHMEEKKHGYDMNVIVYVVTWHDKYFMCIT